MQMVIFAALMYTTLYKTDNTSLFHVQFLDLPTEKWFNFAIIGSVFSIDAVAAKKR